MKNKEERKAQRKAYCESHKEEMKTYLKAYRESHKEEMKAQMKAYNESHKEEIKAYRESHKEEIKAQMKAYKESHKEEIKAQMKAYYESHKEEMKRIKKKLKEIHKFAKYDSTCYLCGKIITKHNKTLHHITYFPEKEITLCKSCHISIHHQESNELVPPKEEMYKFYGTLELKTNI